MTFRVGMKVVCIKPPSGKPWGGVPSVLGRVYTIRAMFISPGTGKLGLCFEEHINPVCSFWGVELNYNAERFRPIQERKTDISFAHEILRKVSRKDRVRV